MSDFKVGPRISPKTTDVAAATAATAVTSSTTTTKQTTAPSTTTEPPVAALFADTKKEPATKKAGAFRPHETRMQTLQETKPRFANFAAAFEGVLGKGAIDEIKTAIGKKPIVLIAGDQCTGKGTAAEGLVQSLGGENTGTGTVLRALSKENGLSIEQMSALLSGKSVVNDDGKTVTLADYPHLGTAEDVDVKLDFRATKAIASSSLKKADGKTIDISVFESRLAGHLGQFLEGLGRENVVSVYLYAAPRVQAERYLDREVWKPAEAKATTAAEKQTIANARGEAAKILAGLDDKVGLGDALQTLVNGLKGSGVDGFDALAQKVKGIAGRDDNDKSRLLSLYGVNYQDRSAFDVVVDTNGKTPAQVKQAILDAVAKKSASSSAD